MEQASPLMPMPDPSLCPPVIATVILPHPFLSMPRETLNLPLIGTDAGVLLQIIPHLRHSLLLLSFARPTCADPVNAPSPSCEKPRNDGGQ